MPIGGSTATAGAAAAICYCGAGRVASTVCRCATARFLRSLAQQTAMGGLLWRKQWRRGLQIFGIYGKVVAGYRINCSRVDHLSINKDINIYLTCRQ